MTDTDVTDEEWLDQFLIIPVNVHPYAKVGHIRNDVPLSVMGDLLGDMPAAVEIDQTATPRIIPRNTDD